MKFSSQEEYGLRCLLEIGKLGPEGSMTIPEISRAEGLTPPYVAKLLAVLRKEGFVNSTRGQSGGYALARPADQIVIGDVLAALGGRLYDPGFCDRHTPGADACSKTVACSIRALWNGIQDAVDKVVNGVTLADILQHEEEARVVRVHTDLPAGERPWARQAVAD
jgi:Rrf2 family protein